MYKERRARKRRHLEEASVKRSLGLSLGDFCGIEVKAIEKAFEEQRRTTNKVRE